MMLGGMIGGMIGDALGQKAAELKIQSDESSAKSGNVNHDYFSDDKPKSSDSVQTQPASMADLRRQEEAETPAKISISDRYREKIAAREREAQSQRQIERFQKIDSKLGISSPFKNSATLDATQDFYKNQQQFLKPVVNPNAEAPTDTPAQRFGKWLDDIFSDMPQPQTEAAQNAMAGTLEGATSEVSTGYGAAVGEVGELPSFDDVSSRIGEFGASAYETLSTSFEGVGEFVSSIGTQISEGFASAIESASETFNGLGEMISSGLESASSAASGALETISSTFTSTKDAICTAWAEVPTFFSGLFDGLGGVASSAGNAILSGLTSVCGAVVSAWEGVASTVSSIISTISAAVGSIQLPSFGGGVGKAEGGFVSAETHFYAGEHGPEVVIPLSSSRRARALDLLEKTTAILGGETTSFAGDELQPEPERDVFSDTFGVERPAEKLNIRHETQEILPNNTTVSTSTPTSTSNEVQLGGINVTFNVTGDNPDDILSTIREHLNEVTDSIAGKLSEQIQSVHMNQPLSEV